MRRLLASLVVVLSACGGFENTPLTEGVVRGQLLGADATAVISVLNQPALQTTPDATGHFELRVPQGDLKLFVVTSKSVASIVPVTVSGGSVAELGQVAPVAAAVLEVRAEAPSFQNLSAGEITVQGTPYAAFSLKQGTEQHLGPLPAACYDVDVTVPGLGSVTHQVCLKAGYETEVEFHLPTPDGTVGREGCAVTGCLSGLTCNPDGSCSF
jgi:hypothetical protein